MDFITSACIGSDFMDNFQCNFIRKVHFDHIQRIQCNVKLKLHTVLPVSVDSILIEN